MIYIHPAIVSPNTNSNLIPGLCKVLERHVLIYQVDKILTRLRRVQKIKNVAKTAAVTAALYHTYKKMKKSKRESMEFDEGGDLSSGLASGLTKWGAGEIKPSKLETPNMNILSIEPTWTHIASQRGDIIFGVKVVPFYLNESSEIINLLKNDILLKKSGDSIEIFMKQMKGKISKLWHKTITHGSQDIIFGRKYFGRNIFIVLNKMDLEDDLTKNNKDIANLQKLGWTSFIFCDDINKKAYFCMKEYKGFCSSLNYRFIYSALGLTTSKIFDDLEDVKKSSPFFRMTTKSSKLIGESYIESIKDDFDNELIMNELY